MKEWPESLLRPLESRWSEAAQAPSPRLIRLALLRELARAIHAGRSSVMATPGALPSPADLRKFEGVVEALRRDGTLRESLQETLRQAPPLAGPTPPGPAPSLRPLQMSRLVGPGKLERSDRQWELALAREAENCGYSLHAIEATVAMGEVESWSQRLEDSLWPRAVVLFTEAGAPPAAVSTNWTGRWWVCFEPGADARESLAALDLRPAPRLRAVPEAS